MPDRLIAQRVLVRDMPDRSRIRATLRIDHLAGNAHPYFSATADIYEPHGTHSGASRSRRRGFDPDSGGAMHSRILDAFPGARAFVALHLADYPSGTPMHGAANGWYFLTGEAGAYELKQYLAAYAARNGSPVTRCANALRCDPSDIPHELVHASATGTLTTDEHRETFDAFVTAQAPRWEREARAARELLEIMPDVCDLRGYDTRGQAIERRPLPAWLIGADPETVDV